MRFAPVILVVALAGCAVGPDYKPPAPNAPAAFGENGPWKIAAPKDDLPKSGWWRIFKDPVLDGIEERAERENLTLRAALARVDQARAIARISQAGLYPSVALNPSAGRTRYSGNREVQPGASHPAYTTSSFDVPIDLA